MKRHCSFDTGFAVSLLMEFSPLAKSVKFHTHNYDRLLRLRWSWGRVYARTLGTKYVTCTIFGSCSSLLGNCRSAGWRRPSRPSCSRLQARIANDGGRFECSADCGPWIKSNAPLKKTISKLRVLLAIKLSLPLSLCFASISNRLMLQSEV